MKHASVGLQHYWQVDPKDRGRGAIEYSSSGVIFVSTTPLTGCRSTCFTPAPSLVLSILDNIQHHFMVISTLDASLPALEDLIPLVHAVPLPKKVGPPLTRDIRRDILLLRELNDYEGEAEYTYISLSERDACKMKSLIGAVLLQSLVAFKLCLIRPGVSLG